MSGANVAYHLRQNKAVDRHLFIDLLSKVNRYVSISDHIYISFGGAFLEDFKLIHSHFGNKNMMSIENDAEAYKRQKFNLPLSCINCLYKDSAAFVDDFESNANSIVWLDYADAKKTRTQIQEFETLLSKLMEKDIVKITLNANPDSLYKFNPEKGEQRETIDEQNAKRLNKLISKLGDYMPNNASMNDMTMEGLPKVLIEAVGFAANKAINARRRENLIFQPLSSFVYIDGAHQMLTITGIILNKKEISNFFKVTGIKKWRPASIRWEEYKRIEVPALTAREKVYIDQLLPKRSTSIIHKRLKFLFHTDRSKSFQMINNYKLYYRYYPNFHRVVF